ncbi:MAG: hypothetical protein MUF45_09150 [Spirosomaceae bacterium]|jgi:hypothetical protein|nr:hypothetical protein [Spirosomataceae bacterium]
MKYIKSYSILLVLGLFMMACETQMVDKLDDFNLPNGGYMRTVTPFPVSNTTWNVSKANMAGTKMEAVLEAVTPNAGANFASYELVVRQVGSNNAVLKADAPLRTLQASQFTKDAQTGYPRFTLSITGKEAQDALRLTDAEVVVGSRFEVRATMVLTDGKRFNASNTGVNITGGAFYSSPFFYRVNIVQ